MFFTGQPRREPSLDIFGSTKDAFDVPVDGRATDDEDQSGARGPHASRDSSDASVAGLSEESCDSKASWLRSEPPGAKSNVHRGSDVLILGKQS